MNRNPFTLMTWMASFLFMAAAAGAQQETAVIHIKLVNGLTGQPLTLTDVGLELSPNYQDLKVRTDNHGVATLHVPAKSTLYTHNTKQYVACADEAGGLVHNDFKVSQIMASGVVQAVALPNRCKVTTSAPVPGELIVFVRPWGLFEDNPL